MTMLKVRHQMEWKALARHELEKVSGREHGVMKLVLTKAERDRRILQTWAKREELLVTWEPDSSRKVAYDTAISEASSPLQTPTSSSLENHWQRQVENLHKQYDVQEPQKALHKIKSMVSKLQPCSGYSHSNIFSYAVISRICAILLDT